MEGHSTRSGDMHKLLIGSILLTAFATPALADDFYIV
jgi:hypothetical protein